MGFSSTINSVCPEFSKVFFSVCTASLQAFIIIESFQGGSKNQSWSYNPACTPLKTNIAPEKWWLEDEFPFEIADF